jgi:hypothetical protein
MLGVSWGNILFSVGMSCPSLVAKMRRESHMVMLFTLIGLVGGLAYFIFKLYKMTMAADVFIATIKFLKFFGKSFIYNS